MFLQTPFIHLIAPLLGGHPRVGPSKFQAGGLVQSLMVPSSSSWNWCSQQYKPHPAPSSINQLDPSCGSPWQVHMKMHWGSERLSILSKVTQPASGLSHGRDSEVSGWSRCNLKKTGERVGDRVWVQTATYWLCSWHIIPVFPEHLFLYL